MGKKYRIEYDREGCIGAFSCVSIDPDHWEMAADNKADLIGGEKEDGIWVREVEPEDEDALIEGAQACPVNVIKIIDMETGEVVAP